MRMMEHEVRAKLLNATIADVIEICDEKGDELILVMPAGDAVSINAAQLRLTYVPNFEAELSAIEVTIE